MKAWLVNTNSKPEHLNPNGFKFMLRQNKVSAFEEGRHKVDKIQIGDIVLLYHNENRVIAVGFALNTDQHDYTDVKEFEHFIDINWIWKVDCDQKYNLLNPINRYDLKITMVNNTVVNITDQIDYKILFEEIGKRQNFLI